MTFSWFRETRNRTDAVDDLQARIRQLTLAHPRRPMSSYRFSYVLAVNIRQSPRREASPQREAAEQGESAPKDESS
jgi:hypothetical protein